MSKFVIALAAAAATLAVASPSFAAEKAHKAKVIQRNGETLYCVKVDSPATGTNIPQRVCRTQAEWAANNAKVLPKTSSERLAANPQAVASN